MGLPFSLSGLLSSLCIPPPVLGLAWEETSVAPPGSRNGVMTSRCAKKRPAPPPGAARPSGSVGAGPVPFPPPPSDTGGKECPGLNGPCVKLLGGRQNPRTPPKAGPEPGTGPEQEQSMDCAEQTELSPQGEGSVQTPPSCPLTLPPHTTAKACICHYTLNTWPASLVSAAIQSPSTVKRKQF